MKTVKMRVTGGDGVSVVSSAGTGEWLHGPDDISSRYCDCMLVNFTEYVTA